MCLWYARKNCTSYFSLETPGKLEISFKEHSNVAASLPHPEIVEIISLMGKLSLPWASDGDFGGRPFRRTSDWALWLREIVALGWDTGGDILLGCSSSLSSSFFFSVPFFQLFPVPPLFSSEDSLSGIVGGFSAAPRFVRLPVRLTWGGG